MKYVQRTKYYNIIAPLWALYYFPPIILFAMIINFIIDAFLIICTLKIFKVSIINKYVFRYISISFIFGFFIDFIAALSLYLACDLFNINAMNAFESTKSIIVYLFIIIITGGLIFIFNYLLSKKYLNLEKIIAISLGAVMGILTAPWFFLIKTNINY